jgi:hypothetical protein
MDQRIFQPNKTMGITLIRQDMAAPHMDRYPRICSRVFPLAANVSPRKDALNSEQTKYPWSNRRLKLRLKSESETLWQEKAGRWARLVFS